MELLEKYRKQIDEVDRKIIEYLGKRYKIVKKVGLFKKRKGLKPLDKKRWFTVLKTRISWGEKNGLPETLIKKIYQAIHQFSLKVEKEI